MAIARPIRTSFWLDSKVVEQFTPEDKYFFLYLLTNPHTTQLGIYELNLKQAAFEMGYSVETIQYLLDRFEKSYELITYNKPTKEIVIKNYLIHSIIKGGKPVEDCLKKEIKQVKEQRLITILFENLIKKEDIINETVKQLINKYLNDDKENDNENDNENERIVHESCLPTPNDNISLKSNGFKKPTIEEIKAYTKEKGYKLDAEHFYNYYESNGWKVGKVPMKSWQGAIITWLKRDGGLKVEVKEDRLAGLEEYIKDDEV